MRHSVFALLALFALALVVSTPSAHAQSVLFFDDFTGSAIDMTTWKHELTLGGGGNWEFEGYFNNRTVSYVQNGVLFIKPRLLADMIGEQGVRTGSLDLWGSQPANMCTGNAFYGCSRSAAASGNYLNPIMSARLRTAESFTFKYGRVEIRAKLPRGDWLWPAIWLLPADNYYGEWPASGEIDIVESRGNDPSYPPGGRNKFGSTLHWGPYYNQDKWPLTHAEYTLPSGDFSTDFHTFGLYWSETEIYTYIDSPSNHVLHAFFNKSLWEQGGWGPSWANPWTGRGNNAPFDQKFYLIFNVAVGGTSDYFPDGYGKPWSNTSPTSVNQFYDAKGQWYPTWQAAGDSSAMQIDWVRVTSLT